MRYKSVKSVNLDLYNGTQKNVKYEHVSLHKNTKKHKKYMQIPKKLQNMNH